MVVLDFDLSWHKGAAGKSVNVDFGEQLGYLAPEQLDRTPRFSTRNANVYSYGIGMTLYFFLTSNHPASKSSLLIEDWLRQIEGAISLPHEAVWRSNRSRIARLIAASTRYEQNRRPDFNHVVFELERILATIDSPKGVDTAEFWAEEVLARAFPERGYDWDEDRLQGTYTLMRGVVIKSRAVGVDDCVQIEAERSSTGEAHWSNIEKYIARAKDTISELLQKGGWRIEHARIGAGRTIVFIAAISVHDLRDAADRAASSVREAASVLSFQ